MFFLFNSKFKETMALPSLLNDMQKCKVYSRFCGCLVKIVRWEILKLLYDGSLADFDTGYILMALLYFEKHFLTSNIWDSVAFFLLCLFHCWFVYSLTNWLECALVCSLFKYMCHCILFRYHKWHRCFLFVNGSQLSYF